MRPSATKRRSCWTASVVGTDELFDFVGQSLSTRSTLAGHWTPFRSAKQRILYRSPTARAGPLPSSASLVAPRAKPAEDANFKLDVRSMRREAEGALHELIEGELARRAGFDLTKGRPPHFRMSARL